MLDLEARKTNLGSYVTQNIFTKRVDTDGPFTVQSSKIPHEKAVNHVPLAELLVLAESVRDFKIANAYSPVLKLAEIATIRQRNLSDASLALGSTSVATLYFKGISASAGIASTALGWWASLTETNPENITMTSDGLIEISGASKPKKLPTIDQLQAKQKWRNHIY